MRTDMETEAAFFRHQLGIRHRMPTDSMASTCFKKVKASSAVSFKGWNISPFSIKELIKSETSAARFRQERRFNSFSRSFLYSVSAYCRGTWRTLPSVSVVA